MRIGVGSDDGTTLLGGTTRLDDRCSSDGSTTEVVKRLLEEGSWLTGDRILEDVLRCALVTSDVAGVV